jgi:hypothetical protein
MDRRGLALSMFQVRRPRVPETISAKTVRKQLRLTKKVIASVVIAASSDKKESRETWVLSGREQGEHLN